jgi:hypothetical protein
LRWAGTTQRYTASKPRHTAEALWWPASSWRERVETGLVTTDPGSLRSRRSRVRIAARSSVERE